MGTKGAKPGGAEPRGVQSGDAEPRDVRPGDVGSRGGGAGSGAVRGVRLEPLRPDHADALEALQIACYPTMGAQERMRAEHFLRHAELFPEGTIVAVEEGGDAAGRVIGLGSGLLLDFDFDAPAHRFRDMISDGWYDRHDPAGAWYYGADISVHPEARGRGVGRRLYEARKALVRRLGRRGIVAGGMLPGYDAHRYALDVPAYVDRVVAGELHDPTLSFQLANGFRVVGMLPGYLEDPASDDWATLIVWESDAS